METRLDVHEVNGTGAAVASTIGRAAVPRSMRARVANSERRRDAAQPSRPGDEHAHDDRRDGDKLQDARSECGRSEQHRARGVARGCPARRALVSPKTERQCDPARGHLAPVRTLCARTVARETSFNARSERDASEQRRARSCDGADRSVLRCVVRNVRGASPSRGGKRRRAREGAGRHGARWGLPEGRVS